MNNKEKNIIERLIAGGIIGAALGSLLSEGKRSGTALGALAGAAFFASLKANEEAKKTDIPLVLEENDVIYRVRKNGSRVRLKKLPNQAKIVPEKFKLR